MMISIAIFLAGLFIAVGLRRVGIGLDELAEAIRDEREPVVHNVWVDGKPVPFARTEGGPTWYSHKSTKRTTSKI